MEVSAVSWPLARVNPSDLALSSNGQVGLVLTWVVCLIIVLAVWWLLPKPLRRLYRWADLKIALDLSHFEKPTLWLVSTALTALVLIGGGVATADIVGLDIGWAKDAGKDVGLAVGIWIGPRIGRIALILVLGTLALRTASRLIPPLLKRFLVSRATGQTLPDELAKRERTLSVVMVNAVRVLVIMTMGFIILSEMGVNLAPLLAAAGVAGIAIGFGAQSLVRDIFSGIFILMEDQYRVGDVVRIGGVTGLVEDIDLRHTTLRDRDFIQHIVPNGEIHIASNFTKEKSRVNMNISVAYKEDLDRVMGVINQVGAELSQDPDFGPLITSPLKALWVDSFEASGIAIKVLGETLPTRQWDVAGEFRRRIKRAFDQEDIVYWGPGAGTWVRQLQADSLKRENPKVPTEDPSKAQSTKTG